MTVKKHINEVSVCLGLLNGYPGSETPNETTLPYTCAMLEQDKEVVFHLSGLISPTTPHTPEQHFLVLHKP